jgi:adenylate cyclase
LPDASRSSAIAARRRGGALTRSAAALIAYAVRSCATSTRTSSWSLIGAIEGGTDRRAGPDCPRPPVTVGGIEIERKFLVPEPPDGLERHPSTAIDQGYLAIAEDGTEVRIRRRDASATLTVKSGGGRSRVEEELDIDAQRFDRLWPLTEGRRIEKTRYEIPAGDGLTIELDVYAGALDGLVVAEIEFDSEDAAERFSGPGWLGQEVTDDKRYKNQRLACDGAPG